MNADGARINPTPAKGDSETHPYWDVTEKIIGAAFEVHRELGPGFLEAVYETALWQELSGAGVATRRQAEIAVSYKGQPVGVYYADLLVEDRVICEIKAIRALDSAHEAQLLHYLKATGMALGLLLNFGAAKVQVKRIVRSR